MNIVPLPSLACLQQKGFTQAQIDAITECLNETPPDPPDPPTGFAPCGAQGLQGTNGWEEWCVRHVDRFGQTSGLLWMRGNTKAMRVRLPGAHPRGTALPTTGSNRVRMRCELGFDEEWMLPMVLGGQHLFAIGQGPFDLADGSRSPDHLRLDFSPARVPGANGVGFQNGLRCLVYEAREGQGHRERWLNFETAAPVWTEPGEMAPVEIEATLTGDELQVSVQFWDAQRIVRSMVLWPGQPMKLGDAAEFGNFDGRSGRCYIGHLTYETI